MNAQTQNALNQIFNITPTELPATENDHAIQVSDVTLDAPLAESISPEELRAEEDFLFSRGALKSLAVEAQNTLHRAVEVAEQTDKASSFTAVAELLRATIETHKELQQLHKTAADVRLATKTTQTPVGQVNIDKGIVFQGGADELLKLIDPSRK
jgi:hypothetical protein